MSVGPLLTVGILSFNRLHYLRATLESARRCIKWGNVQYVIVDNESTEPGLREYLEGLNWVQHKIFRRLSMGDAMNLIVDHAAGDVVLLWPDDMQFIVEGDWMADCVEVLMANPWIGSLGLAAIGRRTIQRTFTWRRWLNWRELGSEIKRRQWQFRRQAVVRSSRGFTVRTFGWTRPGIVGSGIPCLTRTEVWRRLGIWKTVSTQQGNLVDSSGGGETEMLARYRSSGLALQSALSVIPVAADIITDPIGTKAKVRGDSRYGVYIPPPEGSFYYQIFRQEKLQDLRQRTVPVPFEGFVHSLGYDLPFDERGDLLKASINAAVSTPVA